MCYPIRLFKATAYTCGMLFVLLQQCPALANEPGYKYQDHPRFGTRVNVLPSSNEIKVGQKSYFYHNGIYYKPVNEYMIVPPPVGAVVNKIPVEFKRVVILGKAYYTDNLTYYVHSRKGGYRVVALPDTAIVTVNLTNVRGENVSVNLKKYGEGFLGPRREYYARFPQEADLRQAYGN